MGSFPLPALIATLAVGLALVASPVASESSTPLRVVSFNLLHGGPSSGLWSDDGHLDERLRLVTRELSRLTPDIVALQESSISRGRNVAARLAGDLGLHWAHASATRRVSGLRPIDTLLVWAMNFEEGPAILSRWPIVEQEIYDLPRCAKFYDPRVVLRAAVDSPGGRLQVYSTHLAHDACQTRRLAEILRAHAGPLPALLMGDFNAPESAEWMQTLVREAGLVDAYRAANREASGATVWQRPGAPDPTVTRRVDYVFVVPGRQAATRVRDSRVVLSTPAQLANGTTLWPSDHYGVLADVVVDAREARH
ncbi:MAG TPA: endonuclease/exonuclease/phosphatase family protein [Methylomirabilota bacterium]|nr:endonuclease/exonuclease/phosphatase family protein [Methylomirabilota bacterium]